jgi:hypothetical protein
MGILTDEIRPGALIRSDFMLRVVSLLESLDKRVSDLEKSGPTNGVAITGLIGTKRIGDPLRVQGRGFEVPSSLNTVTLDGGKIDRFGTGGTDTSFSFTVPTTITGAPREVDLVIENSNGTASTSFVVQPQKQMPTGQLVITENTGTLPQIAVGGVYDIFFSLRSETTIAETYDLKRVVENVQGTATKSQWIDPIEFVTRFGSVIADDAITLQPGLPVDVGLRVKVPTGATGAEIGLEAHSRNNPSQLDRTSTRVTLTVGSAPVTSDPRVSLTLQPFGGASQGKYDAATNTVSVPFGGQALVKFQIDFAVAGKYDIAAKFIPAAAAVWSFDNPAPTQVTKNAGDHELYSGLLKLLTATNPGNASEARILEIKVTRQSGGGSDPIGTFNSWTRINVAGR